MASKNSTKFPFELPKKPPGWGSRHTLIILGFVGFAVSYSMRFNLSLAIVAMVHRRAHSSANNSTTARDVTCPHLKALRDLQNEQSPIPVVTEGEFHWNEAEQGVVLGSFFWGYVLTQIPGGVVSQKYGGKWPYGLGLAITAVAALLTPVAAKFDKSALIVIRIVQGLGEVTQNCDALTTLFFVVAPAYKGLTVPSFHVILSRWAPPQERSNLAAIAYGGAQFGTAITMITGGSIIQSNFLGGWPGVFYVIGIITLIWFILWCVFMFDSPAEHPRISAEELAYIQISLGKQSSKVKQKTPWASIMTSVPVWAIIIAHMGQNWGSYTLLTELPTYMRTALHFDIKQNSLVSALPFTMMWIFSIFATRFADLQVQRKIFKVVVVRKMCQVISQCGAAVALVAASYSGCDRALTVALLTTAAGVSGAAYGGYNINHIDIGSNHAGVLMGISNTFSNLCGFAAPYVAGQLINENTSLERWQLVFFLAAGIYVFDSLVFLIFAQGTEQPWNRELSCTDTSIQQSQLGQDINDSRL